MIKQSTSGAQDDLRNVVSSSHKHANDGTYLVTHEITRFQRNLFGVDIGRFFYY